MARLNPEDWKRISERVKARAGWRCIRCKHHNDFKAGRALTVLHFDGDESNCAWWNLLALCQACCLSVRARVSPDPDPWLLDHGEWMKPYVAGFYAMEYLKEELEREEVEPRLEELLGMGGR